MTSLNTYENLSLSNINNIYKEQTEYFQEKILKINLESYPFLHFEEQNLFCDNFYQYVKSLLPPLNQLEKLNATNLVSKNYPDQRYILIIKNFKNDYESLYKKVDNLKLRYNLIKLSNWFSEIVKPKLLKIFNILDDEKIDHELAFCIDTKGYKLSPHTDVKEKIITCLMYLPDDSLLSKFGTNILIPKDKNTYNQLPKDNVRYKDNDFEIVKTTKFIENNTFSFKRSDCSFHSVSELTVEAERKFLLFTIYKK